MIFRINAVFFLPKHHIELHNVDIVCFVWGTNWVSKYWFEQVNVLISALALLRACWSKGGCAVWKFWGVIFLLATDLATERLASEVLPPSLTRLSSRVCFCKVKARACHEFLLPPSKEWSGDIPFILWVCNLVSLAYVTCRTLQNILTSVGRVAYQTGVLIS